MLVGHPQPSTLRVLAQDFIREGIQLKSFGLELVGLSILLVDLKIVPEDLV
jgi:polysaccharide deacetylase 2 family uncharacterized protein YibQ